MIMISLIGEQPIPNLLPIRYQPPTVAVLVHTDFTAKAAKRLERLLPQGCQPLYCPVSAYDIEAIRQELLRFITEQSWEVPELIFNLTGGTKPMALAAYCLAEQWRSPFIYLQSEGGKSLLYRYEFSEQGMKLVRREEIPFTITIDDYLRAYLGDYEEGPLKEKFENMVYEALRPEVDEIKTSVRHGGTLEIDLVLRHGNQVGVVEVKSGRRARTREGIDKLNTAAEQRYLGTYTKKFLVMDRPLDSNNRALAEAHRIVIIELYSAPTGTLTQEDKTKLTTTILKALGG